MRARVQKWGNSLALRIPKSFADEAGLREESPVDVSLVKGKLVVAPAAIAAKYTLKQLLAKITPDNLHGAVDMGKPMGQEAW